MLTRSRYLLSRNPTRTVKPPLLAQIAMVATTAGQLPPLVQNSKRPENWKTAAPFPPKGTTTFSKQDELPKLPIPELKSTLEKLKQSLKPLAHSEEELVSALRKIDEFERNGTGSTLHKRLVARRETPGIVHWLEEFWDNAAYMKYRDTIMTNVSYYYGFSHHPEHLPQGPAARAAALTRSALLFRRDLKQGTLPVDLVKKDPLCMDTMRWMFDCDRVPGLEGADWAVTAAKEGDDGISGHIIFIRKGRFWKVDAISKGERRLLSTAELERQIQYIYDQTTRNYPDVGTLTSSDRDSWAKDYALLAANPNNAAILQEIHSSAFVVCLDSYKPDNVLNMSRALFHGGVNGEELGNRWLDKPLEFIVFDNGEAGFMGEHSVMDGTPTVTMCDVVLEALHKKDFDHGGEYPAQSPIKLQSAPQPLDWTITPEVTAAIEGAKRAASVVVGRQDMNMLTTSYGKDAIKKWGVSPDGWAQMMIQLAYHRLMGGYKVGRKRAGGTYEAATTRKFFKGRTETIRIVTNESMDWCDAMTEPTGTVFSKEDKLRLFREAVKRHGSDATEASKAMGIDRHLFGLKNMVQKGEPLPEMYSDPLYNRASTWVLSTSAIFSPHFTRGYGWGQVVENGFGVPYMTGFRDRLEFTLTSRKDQPNARFIQELNRASEEMRALFEGSEQPPKAKL